MISTMKGKLSGEEQKLDVLKRVEAETQRVEVCGQLEGEGRDVYQWKRTLESTWMSELNELRVLSDENHLKRLVVDLTLDKHILLQVTSNSNPCLG